MSIRDLQTDRILLHWGVGQTSLNQTVLPADASLPPIPARVGTDGYPTPTWIFCLESPLDEKPAGPGVPVAMYSYRLWHSRDDLVSTDGLFRFQRADLKRWASISGLGAIAEIHFSSPSTPAAITTPLPDSYRMVEGAWETRTWHPRTLAKNVVTGFPALTFTIARLRKISLTLDGVSFDWNFSTDADPPSAGTPTACMNRPGQEVGIANRLHYANGLLQETALLLDLKLGQIKCGSPGGWLGPLDNAATQTQLVTVAEGNNATNLAQAYYTGNPWHGTLYSTHIVTPVGPITPAGYVAPGASATSQYAYYVRPPGVREIPSAENLPANFASSGRTYKDDAILFTAAKRYAIDSSWSLGAARWLHISSTGVVTVLRLQRVSTSGLHTATLRIWKDGILTPNGIVGTPVQLGADFVITSPNPMASVPGGVPVGWLQPLWRVLSDAGRDYRYISGMVDGIDGYPTYPLNASPTGDRILVCQHRTFFNVPTGGSAYRQILAVYEVTIDDAVTTRTPVKVWELDVTKPATPPTSYTINWVAHVQERTWTAGASPGNPDLLVLPWSAETPAYNTPTTEQFIAFYADDASSGFSRSRNYQQRKVTSKVGTVNYFGTLRYPVEHVVLANYDREGTRILTRVTLREEWIPPENQPKDPNEYYTGWYYDLFDGIDINTGFWYCTPTWLPNESPGDWVVSTITEDMVPYRAGVLVYPPSTFNTPTRIRWQVANPTFELVSTNAILETSHLVVMRTWLSNAAALLSSPPGYGLTFASPKLIGLAGPLGYDGGTANRATYNPREETVTFSNDSALSCI